MCHATTRTCTICGQSSTRPPTLCRFAECNGYRVCEGDFSTNTWTEIKSTCSERCRKIERERGIKNEPSPEPMGPDDVQEESAV
ncbi:hypothetical protein BS50DRAFT_568952 [Corynespora cassiicola Philippines]|uniref:Uncharacterized protein n=1 Tax=Corynespora cassiicola Philippines TaxID=1448308 RepID=A0A2T2P748_CORCC|nr:hypothetical protein BS50DRAFT_568952 [Corynespora cassiicola Philippines]